MAQEGWTWVEIAGVVVRVRSWSEEKSRISEIDATGTRDGPWNAKCL